MANELRILMLWYPPSIWSFRLAISFGLILLPINHWIYAIVVLLLLTFAYLLFMRKYYPLHEAYLKSKQASIMLIDNKLLDEVAALAQTTERLRMNRDMRNSADDTSQRMLNALEIGTMLPIHRHPTTSETQLCCAERST